MAFTTTPGTGATDATSFIGTEGVDVVQILNPEAPSYIEAQADNDTVLLNSFTGVVTATTLYGGAGVDTISANNNSLSGALISANQGDDLIGSATTSFNNSEVYGGQGDDTIGLLNTFATTVNGNKGNDTITSNNAGTLTGTLRGGQGTDTINLNGGMAGGFVFGDNDVDVINVGNGNVATATDSTIMGNKGDDQMTMNALGASAFTNVSLFGGQGNDVLNSLATATEEVILSGDLGNDTITKGANAQNDTLLGGAGTDTITSNTGTNRIEGGIGIDTITETGGTDDFVQGASDGAAGTATSIGIGVNIAANTTITINTDVITGFDVANDQLIMGSTTIGDANLIGSTTTSAGLNIVYGTYVPATGIFTVAAPAGGTQDALIFNSAAGVNLGGSGAGYNASSVILNNVDNDLTALNFA